MNRKDEIKSRGKDENYRKGYEDGRNDALDKIYTDIQKLRRGIFRYSDGLIDDIEDILNEYRDTTKEQKTGHWIKISPVGIYECSKCHQNVMTSDIVAYAYCHGCGCRMVL